MKKYWYVKRNTLVASGAEQTLMEFIGFGKYTGLVDLSTMQGGDTVVLKQYFKLKPGGTYRKYAQDTYNGVQADPAVYFTEKTVEIAVKITLQQTAGVNRSYDYNFVREV